MVHRPGLYMFRPMIVRPLSTGASEGGMMRGDTGKGGCTRDGAGW